MMSLRRTLRARTTRPWVSAVFVVGAVAMSGTARASSACTNDSDCSKGFTCQISSISGCPAEPACPPGAACVTPPPCTTTTTSTCQPGPCTTDSDCAPDMACHTETFGTCTGEGFACAKGDECPPPPPPTCTTTSVSTCTPKYELPCKVNSDCGDHFTCVPDVATECSGGGSSGSGGSAGSAGASSASGGSLTAVGIDVGVAPTPSPLSGPSAGPDEPVAVDAGVVTVGSCTTTTLTTSSCQVDAIACRVDADCPATWTCVSAQVSIGIACAEPAQLIDGSPSTDPCVPPSTGTPASACQPPYPAGSSFNTAGQSSTPAGSSLGAGASAGSSQIGDAAAPAPVAAASASGASKAIAPEDGDSSMVGCQMSRAPAAPGAGSFLALFGLVGLVLRRRPRVTA